MAHYKSMMDKTYLGAWDVPTDKTAEIVSVVAEKLPGVPGEIKPNKRPVISFKGTEKKLIVNATIGKTIASLYGADVTNWIGKKITLYASTTRAKGMEIECIRVRPQAPTGQAAPIQSQPVDEDMRARQTAAVQQP